MRMGVAPNERLLPRTEISRARSIFGEFGPTVCEIEIDRCPVSALAWRDCIFASANSARRYVCGETSRRRGSLWIRFGYTKNRYYTIIASLLTATRVCGCGDFRVSDVNLNLKLNECDACGRSETLVPIHKSHSNRH